jgi:FkbM family methyltransferase
MNTLNKIVRSPVLRPLRNLLYPVASKWGFPVASSLHWGRTCYVDLRSCLGRGLLITGQFDQPIADFITANLGPGGVFFDVGANVGYFSLLALEKVGPEGEAHAFEVDPRTLKLLRMTQAKGRIDNLSIHPTAVGDFEGTVDLVTFSENYWTYVNLSPSKKARHRMSRLDGCVPDLAGKRVQVIKIDVEGMELKVLQGGRNILQEHRPLLVCEAVPENLARFDNTVQELEAYMAGLGYSMSELPGTNDPNVIFRPL